MNDTNDDVQRQAPSDDAQLLLLRDELAERYEVASELGRGGMATVYRALDVKHDRSVAVKVFHPDFAQSLGAERFLREVQITAKLSHPHILPLYDSGDAAGLLFYVMPLVEGEDLADRLERDKQLPIKEAVQLTREVAEALMYAHSMGLVHRDIKPDNIMLSGGHAVVADFGIARAVDAAGGEKLTQTGMSVGTPAYMSPEQATGDEVDGRSDLYSLGCVLYEMLVGQVPFTGSTPMAIMSRHTMDAVPPPTIMREAIPDELEDVVMRALAKTPADRFQTGMEMIEALDVVDVHTAMHRRPSSGVRRSAVMARQSAMMMAARPWWKRALVPTAISLGVVGVAIGAWTTFGRGPPRSTSALGLQPTSVAVLYFEDETDGDLAHVADGITEGLIARLSRVSSLDVVSRNGAEQYRGSDLSIDSIARALGVGSLVTGTVDQAGDRVRISVRLVDGNSGDPIERAGFELAAAQLVAVEDSVAETVTRLLRVRLGQEVRLRDRRAGASNTDAWVLVQQAERVRKDGEELAHHDGYAALTAYQRADSLLAVSEDVDRAWLEPTILRARVAYVESRLYGPDERREMEPVIKRGIAHADRALDRDATDADALEIRGTLRYWYWLQDIIPDPAERDRLLLSAEQDLRAAVDADGSLAAAHYALSHLSYQKKNNLDAMLFARAAYEEDAYLTMADEILNQLFWTHYDFAQFTEAQRWCDEGRRRFADVWRFTLCQLYMLITPVGSADPGRAQALARQVVEMVDEDDREFYESETMLVFGGVLFRAGMPDSANRVLEAVRPRPEIDPEQELVAVEAVMRTLGEQYDEAVDLLKRYIANNPDHSFRFGDDLHWWWRPLRDHPEFRAIMR